MIRLYEECDREEVIALILGIQREEFQIAIGLEEQADLRDIEHHYLENGGFWVALDQEGHVCGTIALLSLENGDVALKKMFVRPDMRRSSLGRQLMQACFDYCQKYHKKAIYLGTVTDFVQAQKFYQNLGFQQIKKGDLPQDFPVLDVDNTFYQYDL